jgi:hypothetical protein
VFFSLKCLRVEAFSTAAQSGIIGWTEMPKTQKFWL